MFMTLHRLLQILARALRGQVYARPQGGMLIPVRITAPAQRRRTQRPGKTTAFVSSAR
jgi:hypothetical protein